jgi:acyl-CoA thioester hydrolase
MKAALNAYKHALSIQGGDIDALGHVNNVVYLRWVQEAAEAHWNKLSTPAERKDLAWVVLRHEIDYRQSAKPSDRLYALTWVGETEGVRSIRYVQVIGEPDSLLAEAKTTWVLVDAVTQRPKKISPDVMNMLGR